MLNQLQAIKQFSVSSLSYLTLDSFFFPFWVQDGYVACSKPEFNLFPSRDMSFVLGDPVCSKASLRYVVNMFLTKHKHSMFVHIKPKTAVILKECGHYIFPFGSECFIDIDSYADQITWKRYSSVKRSRHYLRKKEVLFEPYFWDCEVDSMAICYMVIEVKDNKQLQKLKNVIIKAVQPQSIERF